MTIRFLNPVQHAEIKPASLAPRLSSLDGITLGLLSNGKENADELLRLVADELKAEYFLKDVVSVKKIGAGVNCSPKVIEELVSGCDAVITATGD